MENFLLGLQVWNGLLTCVIIWQLYRAIAHLEKFKRSKEVVDAINIMVPIGALISWEEPANRSCNTCASGKIIKRRRLKRIVKTQRGFGLKEITTVYCCDSCNLKSVSLRK